MESPDFLGLVRFLVEPFLDSTDSLRIDCEENQVQAKIWIRVAFNGEERGKVFGRGGRNIQAIRTIVRATAALGGWSAYLDVYGSPEQEHAPSPKSTSSPRKSVGRPKPRPNLRSEASDR